MILLGSIYTLYWLRLSEHTDIKTEGYVGITSKCAKTRFNRHCSLAQKNSQFSVHKAIRKYGEGNIIVETICVTSGEHARWLEKRLRPEPFIGWNMQRGGIGNPYLTDEQRVLSVRKANKTKTERRSVHSGSNHPMWKGGMSYQYRKKVGTFVKISKETRSDQAKARNKIFMESGGIWPSSRPEVRQKLSEARKEYFEINGCWSNSKVNKTMWLNAAKIMILRNVLALPRPLLADMFSVPNGSIKKVTNKLANEWNPLDDSRWIKFYEENKTEGDPTIEELKLLCGSS